MEQLSFFFKNHPKLLAYCIIQDINDKNMLVDPEDFFSCSEASELDVGNCLQFWVLCLDS